MTYYATLCMPLKPCLARTFIFYITTDLHFTFPNEPCPARTFTMKDSAFTASPKGLRCAPPSGQAFCSFSPRSDACGHNLNAKLARAMPCMHFYILHYTFYILQFLPPQINTHLTPSFLGFPTSYCIFETILLGCYIPPLARPRTAARFQPQ